MSSSSAPRRRGVFILFEGIDRCGKSTQAHELHSHLRAQGIACELRRFPVRSTPIGTMLDAYLRQTTDVDDRAAHLLFSANRWECQSELRSLLLSGVSVIVDRYAYSGVAFSAAKGLDVQWCLQPERGLPAPDVVLYMTMDVDEAAMRGAYGAERYEHRDFQRTVQRVYEQHLVDRVPGRWHRIAAARPIEDIRTELQTLVTPAFLEQFQSLEINTL